jgi:L-lactate dehydrogenase (cytochrome)
VAAAASKHGTMFGVSSLGTVSLEELRKAYSTPQMYQFYFHRDRGLNRAMLQRAKEAGVEVMMLTVDSITGGNRERDLRTGFRIPEGLGVPSVQAALGSERAVTIEETFALMDPALSWSNIEDLSSECSLPVLVKGLLTAEDAALALEHGAAGIIVSNHGGRQLDCTLASADALPEVVDAVAGRAPVLVDGGVRRGADVAIALALGADAVLVGRPALWGLAAAGEKGALRVLQILREELELTLALCGCSTPAALTRAHLQRAPTAPVYSP